MLNLVIIFMSIVLVNNFLLSQFLGICSFLGVSNKMESAVGMSGAVIFVMVIAEITTCISTDCSVYPRNRGSSTVR